MPSPTPPMVANPAGIRHEAPPTPPQPPFEAQPESPTGLETIAAAVAFLVFFALVLVATLAFVRLAKFPWLGA